MPTPSQRPPASCCCASRAARARRPRRALRERPEDPCRGAGGGRAPAGPFARSHRAALGRAIPEAGGNGGAVRAASPAAEIRRAPGGERRSVADVGAATDAAALLRFAAANGFFVAASPASRARSSPATRACARMSADPVRRAAMVEPAAAGFFARRGGTNIGHNQARAAYYARPR